MDNPFISGNADYLVSRDLLDRIESFIDSGDIGGLCSLIGSFCSDELLHFEVLNSKLVSFEDSIKVNPITNFGSLTRQSCFYDCSVLSVSDSERVLDLVLPSHLLVQQGEQVKVRVYDSFVRASAVVSAFEEPLKSVLKLNKLPRKLGDRELVEYLVIPDKCICYESNKALLSTIKRLI